MEGLAALGLPHSEFGLLFCSSYLRAVDFTTLFFGKAKIGLLPFPVEQPVKNLLGSILGQY
jgi:hypothetical protein